MLQTVGGRQEGAHKCETNTVQCSESGKRKLGNSTGLQQVSYIIRDKFDFRFSFNLSTPRCVKLTA